MDLQVHLLCFFPKGAGEMNREGETGKIPEWG